MELVDSGPWIEMLAYLGAATLVFSAVIGAIAAISPRAFHQLVRITDKKFSMDRIVAILERPIDVDRYLQPCTRILGIGALTSTICIGLQIYTQL